MAFEHLNVPALKNNPENLGKLITCASGKAADLDDTSQWPQQFDWIMTTALKMKSVLKKYV